MLRSSVYSASVTRNVWKLAWARGRMYIYVQTGTMGWEREGWIDRHPRRVYTHTRRRARGLDTFVNIILAGRMAIARFALRRVSLCFARYITPRSCVEARVMHVWGCACGWGAELSAEISECAIVCCQVITEMIMPTEYELFRLYEHPGCARLYVCVCVYVTEKRLCRNRLTSSVASGLR